jgi:hypothetical protein
MLKDCRAEVKREECSVKGCEERRVRGQRYCRKHKNEAQKGYRKRRSEQLQKMLSVFADQAKVIACQIERFNHEAGKRA